MRHGADPGMALTKVWGICFEDIRVRERGQPGPVPPKSARPVGE